MRIELDTTLTRAVRTAARRRHVAPTRLVRRWIEEHLHRERQAA
jgi:hypothetical protein